MSATNRVFLGALAGIAATCAMTAAARAMHGRLPATERYPLPPREIVEAGLPVPAKRSLDEHGRQTATIAAHFGYGARPVRCTRSSRPEAVSSRVPPTDSWSGL
jgi:hypothetical protein